MPQFGRCEIKNEEYQPGENDHCSQKTPRIPQANKPTDLLFLHKLVLCYIIVAVTDMSVWMTLVRSGEHISENLIFTFRKILVNLLTKWQAADFLALVTLLTKNLRFLFLFALVTLITKNSQPIHSPFTVWLWLSMLSRMTMSMLTETFQSCNPPWVDNHTHTVCLSWLFLTLHILVTSSIYLRDNFSLKHMRCKLIIELLSTFQNQKCKESAFIIYNCPEGESLKYHHATIIWQLTTTTVS